MRSRPVLVLVPMLLLALASPAGGAILILPDGSGDYPTAQMAAEAAAGGDTLLLGNGVFTAAINEFRFLDYLGKDLVVRSRSGNPDSCIIRGFNSAIGLFQEEGPAAVLEGVTIEDCRTAVYILHASPTVRNCVLKDCFQDTGVGGAVWIRSAWLSAPHFEDCLFQDNYCHLGGAVGGYLDGGAVFRRCTFRGNRASRGGAIYADGVGISTSVPGLLEFCTFVDNDAGESSVLATTSDAWVELRHCILAYNGQRTPVGIGPTARVDMSCCDVFDFRMDHWDADTLDLLGEEGNLALPPYFCDPDAGDFRLSSRSPCLPRNGFLEAGCQEIMGAWPATDVSGDQRPLILEISDHQDDEGKAVDLRFRTTPGDTLAASGQVYEVQRQDHDQWNTVLTMAMQGRMLETCTAPTRWDTLTGRPGGRSAFRVVALPGPAAATSAPLAGYSRDNTPPAAPLGLQAVSRFGGIDLQIQPSPSPDVHHFEIHLSLGPFEAPLTPFALTTDDTTVNPGITPGATLYLGVAARDTAGWQSGISPLATCPSPPSPLFQLLEFSTQGNEQTTLRWSVANQPGQPAFVPEFQVRRRLGDQGEFLPLSPGIDELEDHAYQFKDQGLPAGDRVAYQVDLVVREGTWPLFETGNLTLPSTPVTLKVLGNPAHRQSSLQLYLPHAAHPRLRVYDLQGRRLWQRFFYSHEGGWLDMSWDGTRSGGGQVAAGVYLIHVRVGDQDLTRKITLLR